jgi:hypothetical protein
MQLSSRIVSERNWERFFYFLENRVQFFEKDSPLDSSKPFCQKHTSIGALTDLRHFIMSMNKKNLYNDTIVKSKKCLKAENDSKCTQLHSEVSLKKIKYLMIFNHRYLLSFYGIEEEEIPPFDHAQTTWQSYCAFYSCQ